jgi:signal transduction histidine kinase
MALASAEQRDLKRAMPGQRDDTASCDGARTVNAAILLARPHVDPVAVLDAKVRDVPELQIDAGALAEVVLNLVLNAAEAIGEADRGRGRITVSLDNAGDAALLVVQDTGPGMSREVLARIFAPRFTTKPEGQGLGLSIARGRVRAAGGDITAHSTPDRGTRFEVNLPLAKKP